MWIKYNPNPTGRNVGDCAVRAIAKVFGISWDRAHELLSDTSRLMGDMPSSDSVWGAVLRQNGFYRRSIPNTCPNCYTAEDFSNDNPYGTYVLGFGGHVATVVDGDLYDSWDSSNLIPVYVWYRKD